MATSLDITLRPTTYDIIARLGKTLTFTVATKAYEPSTGNVFETQSTVSVKCSPPTAYSIQFVDENMVHRSDVQTIVPALNLTFTPVIGMLVAFDSTSWRVVAVETLYSGDLVVAYQLQLRR